LEEEAYEGEAEAESSHVHLCLQHSKKLHPRMDAALKAILLGDPHAVIVLLEGSRVHLPRWEALLGDRGLVARLRFCPRVQHAALLALLQVGDSFLDTFPWGAGVTSAEALGACLPVVTLPAEITVLQLALGQYRAMGLGSWLVARDPAHFAELALRLGRDPAFRGDARRAVCSRRPLLFAQRGVVDEWAAFLERAAKPFLLPI